MSWNTIFAVSIDRYVSILVRRGLGVQDILLLQLLYGSLIYL